MNSVEPSSCSCEEAPVGSGVGVGRSVGVEVGTGLGVKVGAGVTVEVGTGVSVARNDRSDTPHEILARARINIKIPNLTMLLFFMTTFSFLNIRTLSIIIHCDELKKYYGDNKVRLFTTSAKSGITVSLKSLFV